MSTSASHSKTFPRASTNHSVSVPKPKQRFKSPPPVPSHQSHSELSPPPIPSRQPHSEPSPPPISSHQTHSEPSPPPIPSRQPRSKLSPPPIPSHQTHSELPTVESSTSPEPTKLPPPLPKKGPGYRQAQIVLKSLQSPVSRHFSFSEQSSIETSQNACYEASNVTVNNNNTSFNFVEGDTTEDTTEDVYIASQPQQLSSPGKLKPTRPPPPSEGAIRKLRGKRAMTLANPHFKTSAEKILHQRNPSLPSPLGTAQQPFYEDLDANLDPDDFDSPASTTSPHRAAQQSLYEDLDANLDPDDFDLPAPTASPHWHHSQTVSNTSPAPSLPPRGSSTQRKAPQKTKLTDTPVPSRFSRFSPPAEDNEYFIDTREADEEQDRESIYEPVDTSVPIPPQRTKKKIKGTQTMTLVKKEEQLARIRQRCLTTHVSKSDPLARKNQPKIYQPKNKLAPLSDSSRLKPANSVPLHLPVASEDAVANGDVGGVSDYVDMHPGPPAELSSEGANLFIHTCTITIVHLL